MASLMKQQNPKAFSLDITTNSTMWWLEYRHWRASIKGAMPLPSRVQQRTKKG